MIVRNLYTKLVDKNTLALGMIISGGLIYLLYRPERLLMFRITDYIGLSTQIDALRDSMSFLLLPSFVINSLPAGLWTASYLIFMYSSTKLHDRKTRLLLSLPLPISAIILEFMQLLGWCPGTFDIYDLICYIIPIIVFIKSI